jgi:hypothetical protein
VSREVVVFILPFVFALAVSLTLLLKDRNYRFDA